MFPCEEMQDVLYLFKMENEDVQFMEAAMNGRLNGRLSRDAAIVCAVFLGLDIRIDDNEDKYNMCKAVRDMKKKWQRESKALGIEEGKASSAIKEIVIRLLKKSKGILEICDITCVSKETVEDISLELQSESQSLL